MRSSPFRASFLPVHFLGSQCPSSHIARGHGNFASGASPSPCTQAANSGALVPGPAPAVPPGPGPARPRTSERGLGFRREGVEAAGSAPAAPPRGSAPAALHAPRPVGRARAERPPRGAALFRFQRKRRWRRRGCCWRRWVSAGAGAGQRVRRGSARPPQPTALCPAGLASAGKMKIVEEPNTFGYVSARSLVPRPGRARVRLPLPPGPGVPLRVLGLSGGEDLTVAGSVIQP